MKIRLLVILSLLSLNTPIIAQSELTTKSISIFKNGQSFVVKRGNVATTDNAYTLNKIPEALFGTFWFLGSQAEVTQVTSKLEKIDEPIERRASSFSDLLYANKGKQITITTKDDKTYTGIVEQYDLPEEINSIMQLKEAEFSEKFGTTYNADLRIFPSQAPVLMIKMDSRWVTIDPTTIKSLEFAQKPQNVAKVIIQVKRPTIKVQFDHGGTQELTMMYLQNGISWTPTYLLSLVDKGKAKLRLQAEVANNAEDIVNTDINFVLGVPNFKFANMPATLTSLLETSRNQSAPRDNFLNSQMFSNAPQSQKMSEYSDEESVSMPVFENVTAQANEDFHFFNIKKANIEKGGRAHYTLFENSVKIKHIYECNLTSTHNENNYRNYKSGSELPFEKKYSDVFHSIEITNDSKNPLTTGPVMIVDHKTQNPVSQVILKYTGIGQASSIQIAQSPDVRVAEQEKILGIKEQAKRFNNYNYKLYTIENEIVITNGKPEPIELVITKSHPGRTTASTIKHISRQTPPSSGQVNPIDNVQFTITLKAGQILKFTHTYEMYVHE